MSHNFSCRYMNNSRMLGYFCWFFKFTDCREITVFPEKVECHYSTYFLHGVPTRWKFVCVNVLRECENRNLSCRFTKLAHNSNIWASVSCFKCVQRPLIELRTILWFVTLNRNLTRWKCKIDIYFSPELKPLSSTFWSAWILFFRIKGTSTVTKCVE